MIYYKDINGNIYTGDKADYRDTELTGQELNAYLLLQARTSKYAEINSAFDNAMATSYFMSPALGINIDSRRSATKNDLQNIQTLLSKMERESWTSIEYVGYTETKVATKANIEDMIIEIEESALGLYQYKWVKWAEIQIATTIQQIEAVSW